jgi:hypothetical protein
LELSAALINPLNQQIISQVSFTHFGDQLMVIAPPELVGLSPLTLKGTPAPDALENNLATAFDDYLQLLQRKSDELQALGLSPNINAESLLLSTDLQADNYVFSLTADRRGHFQLQQVQRDGELLRSEFGQMLDISEFREWQSLAAYLIALVNPSYSRATVHPTPAGAGPLFFEELVTRFGRGATLPPRSGFEVLVTLRAGDVEYRFAAARLSGRSFRGILAGPQGKMWAERFTLEEFPGVVQLLSETLGVPPEAVTVVEPGVA